MLVKYQIVNAMATPLAVTGLLSEGACYRVRHGARIRVWRRIPSHVIRNAVAGSIRRVR